MTRQAMTAPTHPALPALRVALADLKLVRHGVEADIAAIERTIAHLERNAAPPAANGQAALVSLAEIPQPDFGDDTNSTVADENLSPSARNILAELREARGGIISSELRNAVGLAPETFKALIAALIAGGHVVKSGEKNSTVYQLAGTR